MDVDLESIGEDPAIADLSPRPVAPTPLRHRRRVLPSVVLAGVLLAGGFVVFQFLGSATVFFCNADEIGVKADCSGSNHLRLQGLVDGGSVQKGTPLRFNVSFNGATVPVVYQGDPGGIFCEGIPVVVEGLYRAKVFEGDRILIKHTEQYKAANPNRVAGDKDCGT